jgi:hypothetical protein
MYFNIFVTNFYTFMKIKEIVIFSIKYILIVLLKKNTKLNDVNFQPFNTCML